uniref:RING-type domain-containing protein n=1 Tax=viral metagenome TaxID=1070528 RepID=A0A6C0CZ19_9ZZZZ
MEIIVQHYSCIDPIDSVESLDPMNSMHDLPRPSCVICMETLHHGQDVINLSCHSSHRFHSKCIQQWWNKNKSCPLCRSSIEEQEHDKTLGATIVLLSSPHRRSPYRRGSQCIFVFFIVMICVFSFMSCITIFGTLLTLLLIPIKLN